VNVAVCAVVIAALPVGRLLGGRHWMVPWAPKGGDFVGPSGAWWTLAVGLGTCAAVAGVLLLLTWIETAGVRFFHGGRVTRDVAWSVCAHATYGWVVGAVLVTLGWGLIDLDIAIARAVRVPRLGARLGDWVAVPPVAGFFIGMMVFEYRVYQGIRICRYANTDHP
jgi:hypothetical protein